MEQNLRLKNLLALLLTALLAILLGIFTGNAQTIEPNYVGADTCSCIKEDIRNYDYLITAAKDCTVSVKVYDGSNIAHIYDSVRHVIVYTMQKHMFLVTKDGDMVTLYGFAWYAITAQKKGGKP